MESRESAVIKAENVVALINRYPVLAGISMSISRGETVLLEGPNGAGKTSLLRACGGLLAIADGTLSSAGFDAITEQDLLRQNVGFLGHQNGLYSELTAKENLAFYARAFKNNDADAQGQAAERLLLSKRVLGAQVNRLSAGQKRRVALAALLLSNAELWLLDEPHAGLDSESRDVIDSVIRNTPNVTVVFASHEHDRAHQLAERVIGIDGGHVISDERTNAKRPSYVG